MITFTKTPIIEIGQLVYDKEDPNKKPYRWTIWDYTERASMMQDYRFCNPKEAFYRYTIEFKWRISW